jgi:hypothetical protein
MKCLQTQGPEVKFELATILSKLTPAVAMQGTMLSVIGKVEGMAMLAKVVYLILENARKAMMIEFSEQQDDCLINSSVRIATEHWDLKLEEVALCLYNARKGKYGKTYHRMSEEEIFSWIAQYRNEQVEMLENAHLDKKSEYTISTTRTTEASPFDGVLEKLSMLRETAQENADKIKKLSKENSKLKEEKKK